VPFSAPLETETDLRDRSNEVEVALRAVRAASRACRAVQQRLVRPETLEKRDKSPVTVADFASQAIVCALLQDALPGDAVVGEESAKALREASQSGLRASVVEIVREELARELDADAVLAWIDRGNAEARSARYWTLDPIDGTKGFLRGEQYAVALALIEDGEVSLGVLGCPNLPDGAGGVGALFCAERGGPAFGRTLWSESAPSRQISVGRISDASEARFCESVESGHSDQDESARVAELLGIRSEPYRIDSQCKYAAVARNDASIYLRLPTREDYREKIWDHAAGKLLVEAAGGVVTDVDGRPLDFTRGRTLERNRGVVATGGAIHAQVLDAVKRARSERSSA
jgi:3'(2'), 5'-bisphosphate nucleotidase